MLKKSLFTLLALGMAIAAQAVVSPVDYVNTLMGTQSKFELSNGNGVCSLGYERMDTSNGQKW